LLQREAFTSRWGLHSVVSINSPGSAHDPDVEAAVFCVDLQTKRACLITDGQPHGTWSSSVKDLLEQAGFKHQEFYPPWLTPPSASVHDATNVTPDAADGTSG